MTANKILNIIDELQRPKANIETLVIVASGPPCALAGAPIQRLQRRESSAFLLNLGDEFILRWDLGVPEDLLGHIQQVDLVLGNTSPSGCI